MAQAHVASTANQIINVIEGRNLRRVKFEFRGVRTMQWGDLLQAKMVKDCTTGGNSDTDIDLSGEWFRILRLDNTYSLDTLQMASSAALYPLTATEKLALGLE